MNSLLESDKELFQNSIRYLHDVCALSALNVPALKSFYSTKRRLMELRKSSFLPSNMTRTSVTCQRCLINLSDGPASYRIKAARKQSRFAKKVLAKDQSGKPLTKYQREYLNGLSNFSGNQLLITCKFCKNESLIKLEKPQKSVSPKICTVSSQRKKKKKKKKDKFCGLDQDLVLSLTPQKSVSPKICTVSSQKKKKKDKFCGLDQDLVLSLTPQNVRNLDNYGDLDTSHVKTSNIKIKKEQVITPLISKENMSEKKRKTKKKSKNLSKLSEFLNNLNKSGNSPASSLKHFLKGL